MRFHSWKVCGLVGVAILSLPMIPGAAAAETAGEDGGWYALFDGKSLDGWHASEHQGSFQVEDGTIVVHGDRSHLFYEGPVANHDFKNFDLTLEAMTEPGANSGVYFHTAYQDTGWPSKGYEAQVNNSHEDWRRTGSLYGIKDVRESPAKDNQWFKYDILVRGKRIVLKVDGQTMVDYTEPANPPKVPDGRRA